MNNLFVFCIGGTGLRVMKSLIMLLASGHDLSGYNVVPVLIDPHKDLDELKDLNKLLQSYSLIHKAINEIGQNQLSGLEGFFKTPIKSLNEFDGLSRETYDFDQREDKSFRELINLEAFEDNDINRQLIELLYSEVNLEKPLSVGFKGSPNVGCVVLNETIDNSQWFKTFAGCCKENDKVFIISSIFGGTGASGFPLLVKKIKDISSQKVNQVPIGALSVLPYFDLSDPDANSENKEIDSRNFATKTKSALSYYERELKAVDYLYYIGDDAKEQYVNDEASQHNKAHMVELIGATAIYDFIQKEKPTEPQFPGIAIEKDEEIMDWDTLGNGYKDYIRALADLLSFYHVISFLPHEKWFPLKKSHHLDDKHLYTTDSFRMLQSFMHDFFIKWLFELNANKRSFAPFDLNIDVNENPKFETIVKGKVGSSKSIPFGISYYLLEMIEAANKMDKKETETQNYFRYLIYCSSKAIKKVNAELLK